MAYKTKFDYQQRETIQEEIKNYAKEVEDFTLYVFGSPDCKEIEDLDLSIKERINLFVFDFELKPVKDLLKLRAFNTCSLFEGDFFEQINLRSKIPEDASVRKTPNGVEKSDLILHRWFLHHCNDDQKLESFKISHDILEDKGRMIIIDWFIPDFNTSDERWASCLEYYNYQKKYSMAPSQFRWRRNFDCVDEPNGRGGKFTSCLKIEKMITTAGFSFERTFLHEGEVDNPELFGAVMYICEKL